MYFISFYVITTIILINLFILVLINQFEDYHFHQDNPLHTFKDYLDKFVKLWGLYTYKFDGIKLDANKLKKFLCRLPKPLGKLFKKNKIFVFKRIF
jgi:hypothetical protein